MSHSHTIALYNAWGSLTVIEFQNHPRRIFNSHLIQKQVIKNKLLKKIIYLTRRIGFLPVMNRNHSPSGRIDNNNVSLIKDKYRHCQLLLVEKMLNIIIKSCTWFFYNIIYKSTLMRKSLSVYLLYLDVVNLLIDQVWSQCIRMLGRPNEWITANLSLGKENTWQNSFG